MTDKELIRKAMALLGSSRSKKKIAAARLNGKKGGYPKGRKRKATTPF